MPETKPRVWNADDPQPNDVTKIRDAMGDVWTREWVLVGSNIWTTPDTIPMTWERIAKKYGPLTEVDPSAPATREATGSERPSLDDLARLLAEGMAGEVEKINAEAVAAAADATARAASWWEAAKFWCSDFRVASKLAKDETARANAAEAKLRFANDRINGLETSTAEAWLNHGVALNERKAAEAKLAELQRSYDRSLTARRDLRCKAIAEQAGNVCAQRERDEARQTLIEISDTIGDDDPCHDHADAHSILNQVRSLTAAYFAEPVTDREEPAEACGEPLPSDNAARCQNPPAHVGPHWTHGDGHGSTSWPASEEPALGDVIKCQQCGKQSRSISRGCSNCGLGVRYPCQLVPVSPSEEPAGETKPRTLLGWIVPDHIAFTIDGGSYVHIICRWALEDDCSTTTAKGNLAWIEQFLHAHAHGQSVERQAQEADRG
ncbi:MULTISPECIES: hypothetical protein [Amycolatopsis]|uniref:Uncharacterized protein n=1 Tax=Amycolatopsis albidoflavus TaxID=102226 RepID=A0ABW5I4L0_9PSEU